MFRDGVLVMKGGTALNLFVHDMPRLSVDIDLAFPEWALPREEALQQIFDANEAIAARLERLELSVRKVLGKSAGEIKLVVERAGAQVKLETNVVFRGTVLPPERRALAPRAAELFSAELEVPTLAIDELYGSRLVAALDRQHPRDLFDVSQMCETHGLTDETIACFVLYLAGHNRPMHEVRR